MVGLVFGARPCIHKIKSFVRSRWGNEDAVSVARMNKGVFLFRFNKKDDMEHVMERGPWTFDYRTLALQPWVA